VLSPFSAISMLTFELSRLSPGVDTVLPLLRSRSLSASPLVLLHHGSSSGTSDVLVSDLNPISCGRGSSLGSGGTTWGRQPDGKWYDGDGFTDRGLECENSVFVGDVMFGVVSAALGHGDTDPP
jgi:hypothetical protein